MADVPVGTTKELLEEIYKKTHSNTALFLTSRLEQTLSFIIQESFPHLPTTLKDKLFGDRGPLRDFASKIDIGIALGAITPETGRLLHAVRGIRNVFAHSDDPDIHFEHSSLDKKFQQIPRKQSDSKIRLNLFIDTCMEAYSELSKSQSAIFVVKALQARKAKSSKEKSPSQTE